MMWVAVLAHWLDGWDPPVVYPFISEAIYRSVSVEVRLFESLFARPPPVAVI